MTNRNQIVRESIEENFDMFYGARLLDFALRVRRKMAEKDLKVGDVAARLGVSDANVSRWLRGDQNLQLKTLFQLADALEEPLNLSIGAPTIQVPGQQTDEQAQPAAPAIEAELARLVSVPHPRLWLAFTNESIKPPARGAYKGIADRAASLQGVACNDDDIRKYK